MFENLKLTLVSSQEASELKKGVDDYFALWTQWEQLFLLLNMNPSSMVRPGIVAPYNGH